MARVAIIGSGFSGLSAASYIAAAGHDVHLFEKNAGPGGRARQIHTDSGYLFDMGPSWYWMPDVFEKFFNDFGLSTHEMYDLKLLDPSFNIVFGQEDTMHVPADFIPLCNLFEQIEPGSSIKLKEFLCEAGRKYKTAMDNIVYKPGLSITEFADIKIIRDAIRLNLFGSLSKHVRRYFRNPKLIALMEFPVLFLGASPAETPALYSLMNYAGLKLGTWYPMGGFGAVVKAMLNVAESNGVTLHLNSTVEKIDVGDRKVKNIVVNGHVFNCDAVIATADYNHIEQCLLDPIYRNYDKAYWEKKRLAPSCLIFFIGVNKEIARLNHHNLFFDEDMALHSKEIYQDPKWPTRPLFYVCCTSKTDPHVAPPGHENLFILLPIAPGLEDSPEIRGNYFRLIMERLESYTGENIRSQIDYQESYCINDFISDYNSYKGNAYGLANTLMQTANLKPKIRNKKVKNLFYAGQFTVPGPGVPPSIISGKIAAQQLLKNLNPANEVSVR